MSSHPALRAHLLLGTPPLRLLGTGGSRVHLAAAGSQLSTSKRGSVCGHGPPGCPQRACSKGGCGLPRQKLDSVQVALRSIEILESSLSWLSSGTSALLSSTRSRHFGESPAMLPSAHTACSRAASHTNVAGTTKDEGQRPSRSRTTASVWWLTCSLTSSLGEASSCTKMGTAPLSITTRVCSEVPDATFVSAQAASNWPEPHPSALAAAGEGGRARAGQQGGPAAAARPGAAGTAQTEG